MADLQVLEVVIMIRLPVFVYVIGMFLLPVIAIAGTAIPVPARIGALAGFMVCGYNVLAWLRSPR